MTSGNAAPSGHRSSGGEDTHQTREDDFGYSRYHSIGADFSYEPAECFEVEFGPSTGAFTAADVAEHDPADPAYLSDRADIRVEIGHEFNPALFDEMIALVSRCLHFTTRYPPTRYTVRILEDSRPAGGPQRFRYSVTTTYGEEPVHMLGTTFVSYARVSGLILTGSGSPGNQQTLDVLFENTLRRIRAR